MEFFSEIKAEILQLYYWAKGLDTYVKYHYLTRYGFWKFSIIDAETQKELYRN